MTAVPIIGRLHMLVTTKLLEGAMRLVRTSLRTSLGVVAAAALLLAACSDGGDTTPAESSTSTSTIKIGAIVPFEGQTASLGKSFLEAVRVSIDTLGDTKYNYELVVEDGGTTPAESERAARRLIQEDGAHAIVGGISATG
jgi:ABC-type branched-subunit amino acid transport system substrate-binding protein